MDVTIRAIEVSDWEALAALQQCPKVRQGTLKMPYRSASDTRKRLENPPDSHYQLVAIEGSQSQLVGVVSLTQYKASRQHVAGLGMAVHDDFHGLGIGSTLLKEALVIADDWLNLKRVELSVFVDNAPALHLYEKFGFEVEGTFKKFAFRSGSYIDAYTMARVL